jgi:TolB protein
MKVKNSLRYLYVIILLCVSHPAFAVLDIQITGAAEKQIPIAIVPLAGEEKLKQSISNIVLADLARSGLFKLVDPAGKAPHTTSEVDYPAWAAVDAISIGTVDVEANGRIKVRFHLLDSVRKMELLAQTVYGKSTEIRAIAHQISDLIFEKLTNQPGVFNTRIAYVNLLGKKYQLVIADCDGYDEKVVYSSNSLIMTPSWSPDGGHIAYVVFEKDHAVIYVQSLLTNQRIAVANFPESDSAPAWSPDGRQLAFVLTNDGNSHIFQVRPDGSELQQMTFDDEIDTEPNFSPDGQSIIFESDRSGSVQIYQIPVDGGNAERLTFESGSYFSPHYSPDGNSFVFAKWESGKFHIATEDFKTKMVQGLTNGGWERNPSFAPNGQMILYATEENGHGILSTVSIDGRVKQKITSQTGDILDPIWGPFTKH